MNHLTTLSVAFLLALSLSACDEKQTEPAKAVSSSQTTTTQAASAQTNSIVALPEFDLRLLKPILLSNNKSVRGAEDFVKFYEWSAKFDQKQQKLIAELQGHINSPEESHYIEKNAKFSDKITAQLNELVESTDEYERVLKAFTIKDNDVKTVLERKMALTALSNAAMAEIFKAAIKLGKSTPEQQQEFSAVTKDFQANVQQARSILNEATNKLVRQYLVVPPTQKVQPSAQSTTQPVPTKAQSSQKTK
ncbi:hypothetical protein [Lonepinella sp. BR2474]|uniref:hypothetical protein n=1 Tax=Lonepinella sp. BR2474 TaxID=3434548 RepID=UPI003F6E1724